MSRPSDEAVAAVSASSDSAIRGRTPLRCGGLLLIDRLLIRRLLEGLLSLRLEGLLRLHRLLIRRLPLPGRGLGLTPRRL